MTPAQFFHQFDLHDSGVYSIHYDPTKRECVFGLELCQWRQAAYQVEDPEIVRGEMIFSGIQSYEFVSPCAANGTMDGQLLETRLHSINEISGLENWYIAMIIFDYAQRTQHFAMVSICAESVEWRIGGELLI